MLYRRARYYDLIAGQFTQEDPIGLAGGINMHAYAGGDPVNFSDPMGLCPECRDSHDTPFIQFGTPPVEFEDAYEDPESLECRSDSFFAGASWVLEGTGLRAFRGLARAGLDMLGDIVEGTIRTVVGGLDDMAPRLGSQAADDIVTGAENAASSGVIAIADEADETSNDRSGFLWSFAPIVGSAVATKDAYETCLAN